jgi:hypothetical protein
MTQIDDFAGAVADLASAHPDAADYTPGGIL